jgi:two-component sensor histidine kinase
VSVWNEESDHPALDSVTRSMALALGVGAAAFFALSVSGLLAQSAVFGPLWSWGAASLMFGPMLIAAALSRWIPPRAIRSLAGVTAVGQLGTLATLVLVLPGGTLPETYGTPWPLGAVLMGCACAAVAWRAAITWPYLAVCVVVVGIDRLVASARPIPDLAVQDALHTLLFTAVFTSLALAIRSAGRLLDTTLNRASADTRRLATAEAQMRERGRVEALLHDSVLVALLASSRRPDHAPQVARDALDRLDDLEHRSFDETSEPVDARAWLWRVQAATTQLDAAARFTHEEEGTPPLPADVAEAILEASAEALRNSVIHAGPASRAVHVRLESSRAEVTVIDNGRGFEPDAVDEARLGVRVSIRDRMRNVTGGRAVVVSRPGSGTRVAITWEAA